MTDLVVSFLRERKWQYVFTVNTASPWYMYSCLSSPAKRARETNSQKAQGPDNIPTRFLEEFAILTLKAFRKKMHLTCRLLMSSAANNYLTLLTN